MAETVDPTGPILARENGYDLSAEEHAHAMTIPSEGPDMPDDSALEGPVNEPISSRGGRMNIPLGERPSQKMAGRGGPPGRLEAEGAVNKPIPSRGAPPRAKRRSEQDTFVNLMQPSDKDVLQDAADSAVLGQYEAASLKQYNSGHLTASGQTHKFSRGTSDSSIGFEDMMRDLSELIDVLPLDQELPPQKSPDPLPKQGEILAPYNPTNRPSSRWRCRCKLFTPRGKGDAADTLQALVQQQPLGNHSDFRNPYIKALNQTRKELERSSDLMAEASPAMLLGTERLDALAAMQVYEAEEVYHSPTSDLTCMPEPCRDSLSAACREQPMDHIEMCDLTDAPETTHGLVETTRLFPGYSHILGVSHAPTPRSSVQEFLREAEIIRSARVPEREAVCVRDADQLPMKYMNNLNC